MTDYSDPNIRPPLRLPPGSIRSLMALLIGGMFWALLLFAEQPIKVPLHVYFLLTLLLIFVISHGKSIGNEDNHESSPWWLPAGTIRAVIVLGFLGTLGWMIYSRPEQLMESLTPTKQQLTQWPWLLLALAGGFFLGRLIASGPWQKSAMFRDIQAWVGLLAMFGLAAEIVITVFIQASLPEQIDVPLWNAILTGVVAAYFGIRS